jgi:hypothetical protein
MEVIDKILGKERRLGLKLTLEQLDVLTDMVYDTLEKKDKESKKKDRMDMNKFYTMPIEFEVIEKNGMLKINVDFEHYYDDEPKEEKQ